MITKGLLFFLFLTEIICCDPSYEPSRRDGSDEGSQHMFLCRINKFIPKYHQMLLLTRTLSTMSAIHLHLFMHYRIVKSNLLLRTIKVINLGVSIFRILW